jgi:hypothetical protein
MYLGWWRKCTWDGGENVPGMVEKGTPRQLISFRGSEVLETCGACKENIKGTGSLDGYGICIHVWLVRSRRK